MTENIVTERSVESVSKPRGRPKAKNSLAEKEMDKIQEKFDAFEKRIEELTLDRMNLAPKQETEAQTKMSQKEMQKINEIYLKPVKSVGTNHKFNENFRDKWNRAKEYVNFIVENKEIIGESVELWTYPFGGVACEFWRVPVNKPVWGPRHLAEQLSRCNYHKLIMKEGAPKSSGIYGVEDTTEFVIDETVPRIECNPVLQRTSTFMGSKAF